MDFVTLLQLLEAAIRAAVPLLFAALAGLYSERSGIVDIGLEGKMLAGAFAAAAATTASGSLWLGLGAGIAASIFFSLVHGFASITVRGNQIVSGVAINFIALGLAAVLSNAWFGQSGRTPSLSSDQRFGALDVPGVGLLADVPYLGQALSELVSGHTLLTYIAFLMVPATWWVLFRTRFGLRLRAVGENPAAVDTAGISVAWLRYRAVIICGVLCGLGGAYLSTAVSAGYVSNMTAGRGFIALAALIFAKWRPGVTMWTCLMFGLLSALENRYQGVSIPGIGAPPVELMQALPFIAVVLLVSFVGKATPPRAAGVPYVKER